MDVLTSILPDPLHPAVIHFPIALAMAALLVELIARHPRARGLEGAAALLVVLGAVAAVVAVLTGNAAHDEALVPPDVRGLLDRHQDVGELAMWTLIGVAAVRLLLVWRRWFHGVWPWVYLVLLAVAAGMVGYNGYLGGEMVFRHGLGTAPVQRGLVRPVASPPSDVSPTPGK